MNNLLVRLLSNRILVISVLLGFVLFAVFFVYYFIIHQEEPSPETGIPLAKESGASPSPQQPQTQEEEKPTPEPTEPPPGEIRTLSTKEATDSWISPDGQNIRYLLRAEGIVYQINTKIKKEEKFSSFTPNLIKILWSPNGYHLINIFKQNGKEQNIYSYNLITKENTLLSPNFKYIVWSADGDEIAYHYFNPETEEGFISIANPEGKNWENLTPVLPKDLKVEWPKKDKISFYHLFPSSTVSSDLHIINPETKEPPQKILSQKYGLIANWSPSGDKLLFSSSKSSGINPKLSILNEALEEKGLDIEGIADKCVWSKTEKYLYCALPQNMGGAFSLPQDWYLNKFLSQDLLFKIDINSGEKTQITKEAAYDFSNLLVSPDDSYLYFISKESGFLYEVKL